MSIDATPKKYMLYQTRISLKSSFRLENLVYALYVHDLNCYYNIETNSIRNSIIYTSKELRIPKTFIYILNPI
uniref:Uncharacterized protein n=1 Tax=Lepeophtheirus salmonis TaxID=72036 RepID=A0A0K2VCP7_LEPSM